MSRLSTWFAARIEALKNTYRLVIMNDETFEEVGSYRLTRLNLYILGSSIFVANVILVTTVIAFTSLKEYIPGYGDVNLKGKADELERKVTEVEKELIARDQYIRTIQRVLTGDVDTSAVVEDVDNMAYDTATFSLDPIPEDYALRTEVEREEMQTLGDFSMAIRAYEDESLDQLYFLTPLNGAVVSDEFQPDKGHYGIDLLGATSAPVLSTLDGVVVFSDYTFDTGYVIGVQHSNNLLTLYKHNSKLLKSIGDKVKAGEALAIVGNTGELTEGPHLHFEVWHNSKPVNPRTFIVF